MRNYEGYHRSTGPRQPSAAQQRVLEELAAGRSNPQIATALGLSVETVKWHIAQLLAETGCTDRVELARWWRRQAERRRGLAPVGVLLGYAAKAALPVVVLLAAAATAVRLNNTGAPPPPSPVPVTAPQAHGLVLVAAGFSVPTRSGEAGSYAFVLDNTDGSASGVAYTVRLLDAAGHILDRDSGIMPSVPAGARLGWTGSYGSGGSPPTRIEVELGAVPAAPAGAAIALAAGPANVRLGVHGPDAVGRVSNPGAAAVRDARVNAVAYDAAGSITGGGVAYIPLVRPGQETTVAVRLYASAAPARVEFYPALAGITTIDDPP